ncbi:starch synthase (maltosyl-transferring) [Catalinimonas alkaloidigena]|uniref:Alpha-1,4-glucan:maltose-1-phosphate maltosyltransferase n=1 Tax=Catalinimonas alkaloidigena TaxID=1075417 RepID=A0A1G9NWH7_9BACT|nr:alpha-1,4-glucan--maltose-1-phosphate maltosyltransferase [Catalinimonas alkaloidigena]SDL90928.1 starch synthase (maltosyl-transferring) [Catalinimonas alkaloidigena]
MINLEPETQNKSALSSLQSIKGKRRVVIEHVKPLISCGRYPLKRVVDESVHVSADVFGDGHDSVNAALLFRAVGEATWQEAPMHFVANDRWEGSFAPDREGLWEFTVQGWIDHYTTWQKGLKKKFEDNQNIAVELLIGAEMMEKAANVSDAQREQLYLSAHILREKGQDGNLAAAVAEALSQTVSQAMLLSEVDKENASYYEPYVQVEVEHKKALFSTWYEFFPRSAASEPGQHGTFKDCERLLPRIAQMGFDVLYFPPIHPIGYQFRKGKNNSTTSEPGEPGSPWAIGSPKGGHKAIAEELGTEEDFVHLVNQAKEQGIDIALDIAFQCSPDHPYVQEHPQWFKWRPDGTVQYAENPPKKYQDVLPINFETEDWQALWLELKSVFDHWIERGVTVFRVDNPHTKSFYFWEWCIGEIRKEHPETIFLAEAFTRPRVMERLAKIGYTQSYTYFTWRNSAWELKQYMTELTRTDMREYFRPNFWPNTPDILPGSLQQGGEPAFITRVVMAATMSSNYGLYGPVYEFGINTPVAHGKEEYLNSEKYEVKHWDWDQYTKIRDVITKINWIRKENPALQSTWNIHFGDCANEAILCYGKRDERTGNIIVVVVNLDPHNMQSGWVRVPVWDLGIAPHTGYVAHDLLTEAHYNWFNEWNYVELHPYGMPVHVFRLENYMPR